MGLHAFLLVLVCYHLLFHDKVQCNWNLSRKEDFDIDKQLKLLNKPAVRTIVNKYGDTYDCVDFYKQLAFDHPLSKNQTGDLQINSISLDNTTGEQVSSEIEVCPIGSVPIRRIAKNDLVREREAFKNRLMDTTNLPGTYLAIARTERDQGNFAGAEGWINIQNPKLYGNDQFSTTRLKLQIGPNSIEAGWRVDPVLYGDNQTRLFVRTDSGRFHCFNTRCPGFVHTNRGYPIDEAFSLISEPGGTSFELPFRIVRDAKNGNWNFIMGKDNIHMGFWPSYLFPGLANYIEWGGAAYSSPGLPLPQMGSGNFPIGNTQYDGFICRMKMIRENGQIMDADYIELQADDSSLYAVRDFGLKSGDFRRTILYGGPGKKNI